jgi:hypothetical protein
MVPFDEMRSPWGLRERCVLPASRKLDHVRDTSLLVAFVCQSRQVHLFKEVAFLSQPTWVDHMSQGAFLPLVEVGNAQPCDEDG